MELFFGTLTLECVDLTSFHCAVSDARAYLCSLASSFLQYHECSYQEKSVDVVVLVVVVWYCIVLSRLFWCRFA
jgi:hypothetical protein